MKTTLTQKEDNNIDTKHEDNIDTKHEDNLKKHFDQRSEDDLTNKQPTLTTYEDNTKTH